MSSLIVPPPKIWMGESPVRNTATLTIPMNADTVFTLDNLYMPTIVAAVDLQGGVADRSAVAQFVLDAIGSADKTAEQIRAADNMMHIASYWKSTSGVQVEIPDLATYFNTPCKLQICRRYSINSNNRMRVVVHWTTWE